MFYKICLQFPYILLYSLQMDYIVPLKGIRPYQSRMKSFHMWGPTCRGSPGSGDMSSGVCTDCFYKILMHKPCFKRFPHENTHENLIFAETDFKSNFSFWRICFCLWMLTLKGNFKKKNKCKFKKKWQSPWILCQPVCIFYLWGAGNLVIIMDFALWSLQLQLLALFEHQGLLGEALLAHLVLAGLHASFAHLYQTQFSIKCKQNTNIWFELIQVCQNILKLICLEYNSLGNSSFWIDLINTFLQASA